MGTCEDWLNLDTPSPAELSEEAPAIRGAFWPRQEPASQVPDAAAERGAQMATACGPRSEAAAEQ